MDINKGSGDVNTGSGTLSQGIPLSANGCSLMSNGYGSAPLSSSIGNFKMQLYLVDNNTVFFDVVRPLDRVDRTDEKAAVLETIVAYAVRLRNLITVF